MKVLTSRPLRALAALVVAGILVVGCASPTHSGGKKPSAIVVPITSLALSHSLSSIEVDQTKQLVASVQPETTTEAVLWTSSDPSVATVSQSGLVTGKAVGQTTITASSPSDGNIKATCVVKVLAAGGLTDLSGQFDFLNQSATLVDGTTASLPSLSNNILQVVNTDNTSLVKTTVVGNSMVVFKTPMTGNFTFRARVKMSSPTLPLSADRGVTVAAYARTSDANNILPMAGMMYRTRGDIRSYYYNASSAFAAGSPNIVNDIENTNDVERTVEVKRTDSGYTFSLYVPKTGQLVATADVANEALSTEVTGTAPVYLALTAGGVTANFANIQIIDGESLIYESPAATASPVPVKGLSLTGPQRYADANYDYYNAFNNMASKELQLTGATLPSYADDSLVEWTTSDATVATVSATGLVTVLKGGTATITATSHEGGYAKTFKLNISSETVLTTSIVVNGPSTLMAGLKAYLTTTTSPAGVTTPDVVWSSSNAAVASVDSQGVLNALTSGTTEIRATATDGTSVFGALSLTVSAYSASVWSWDSAVDSTFALYDSMATPVYPTINGKTLVGRSATTVLTFTNGSGVVLASNRFFIGTAYSDTAAGGGTLGATTGSFNPPDGQFNFTKKAKLTIGYSTANAGTSNGITVYLNNNGTSDSVTGTMLYQAADAAAIPAVTLISSKLYESGANSTTPTQAPNVTAGTPGTFSYIIDPTVFTKNPQILAKSFLQIRAGSAATITITSLKVEYVD